MWKEIQLEVEKKIGRQCGANSCKYKYDTMKNEWRLWKELKTSKTSLGKNPIIGNIEASDEWWLKKIEVSSPTIFLPSKPMYTISL